MSHSLSTHLARVTANPCCKMFGSILPPPPRGAQLSRFHSFWRSMTMADVSNVSGSSESAISPYQSTSGHLSPSLSCRPSGSAVAGMDVGRVLMPPSHSNAPCLTMLMGYRLKAG